jgi:hypothetical protein
MTRAALTVAAVAILLAISTAVFAQSGTNAQVNGTISGSTIDGGSMQGSFTCTGTPNCTGQYSVTSRDPGCSNSDSLTGAFAMSGLSLAQSGTVQGLMVLDGIDYQNDRNPNGTCTIRAGSIGPGSASYTGNWNVATGTGSFRLATRSSTITGTVRADIASSVPVTDNTQLSGSFGGTGQDGSSFQLTFSCRGSPTCAGQFSSEEAQPGCSNPFRITGAYLMTGLSVAQSGAIRGMAGVENSDYMIDHLPNGTCAIQAGTQGAAAAAYQGTWDAARGTGTLTLTGTSQAISGTVKADVVPPPPVFPIAVTSTINATTASATAVIQFRAQDVGANASVFTFAVAPSTLVKSAADGLPPYVVGKSLSTTGSKDTPVSCVLAQLSQSGQLIAVTAAQLQAYLSGVLSAQGASVSILNGVPTASVAGATFYVGYGANGTAMFTNGIYQTALTVPGGSICPMFSSQTALWWNPAESGWGLNLNNQGNIVFATLFTYEAGRTPMWLVMSNGAMQTDGVTFTGDLYRTTGPAFNANPFTPIGAANLSKVGTMTVSFVDVNGGTLRYTVNGVEVGKAIQRQVFGARAAACFPTTDSRASATNYQDLWWNAAESGWGLNVTHQDSTVFATLFTYDASGKGLWLVMSAGTRQTDGSYLGDLYRTAGPAFNANPFTPIGASDVTTVGSMRLRFTDGNNGTLTYTYNGVTVTKAITRQVFASTVPACS